MIKQNGQQNGLVTRIAQWRMAMDSATTPGKTHGGESSQNRKRTSGVVAPRVQTSRLPVLQTNQGKVYLVVTSSEDRTVYAAEITVGNGRATHHPLVATSLTGAFSEAEQLPAVQNLGGEWLVALKEVA